MTKELKRAIGLIIAGVLLVVVGLALQANAGDRHDYEEEETTTSTSLNDITTTSISSVSTTAVPTSTTVLEETSTTDLIFPFPDDVTYVSSTVTVPARTVEPTAAELPFTGLPIGALVLIALSALGLGIRLITNRDDN